jgi:hypothetical protein
MKPVEQAACDALQVFLAQQLTGVTVGSRWPAPDKPLPAKAVTITRVGARKDFEVARQVTKVTSIDSKTATTRYRVKACTQGVQLNVWATNGAVRDDIQGRLDAALNLGTLYTIDPAVTGIARSVVRDGPLVMLNPASGHEGFADFTFDGAMIPDTPESIGKDEFCAIYQGELSVQLDLVATTPLLLRVLLQQHLTPSTNATDEYALSSDGIDFTYLPPT